MGNARRDLHLPVQDDGGTANAGVALEAPEHPTVNVTSSTLRRRERTADIAAGDASTLRWSDFGLSDPGTFGKRPRGRDLDMPAAEEELAGSP